MSIITKALKKAQETRSDKQTKDDMTFTYMPVEPAVPVSAVVRFRGITASKRILMAAAFAAGIILVVSFVLWIKTQPGEEKKPVQVISVPPAAYPITPTLDAKKTKYRKVIPRERSFRLRNPSNVPMLTGIMYSPVNPQAVINGAMVSKGEIVDGFEVMEVLQDKVRMVSPTGKEFELKLR